MAIFSDSSKSKAAAYLKEKLKSVLEKGKEDRKNYARIRIQRELQRANHHPPTHCSYGVVALEDEDGDIFKWQGAIMGPSDTPYEGGVFFLSIEFTHHYPHKPPKIKFLTKVFHPNITHDGSINIDILGSRWSPSMTVEKLLLSICSLLADPDADRFHSPICNLYRFDRKSYNLKAKEWTFKYAIGLN